MSKIHEKGNFYPERSGNGYARMVEDLQEAPTHQLKDDQIFEVRVFENQLAGMQCDGGLTVEEILLGVRDSASLCPTIDAIDIGNMDRLKESLISQGLSGSDLVNAMQKAAIASKKRLVTRMARGLIDRDRPDVAVEAKSYVVDPDGLLKQASSLSLLRQLLLSIRSGMEGDNIMPRAKRAVLEVYQSAGNDALAKTIPMVMSLFEQASNGGDAQVAFAAKASIPRHFGSPQLRDSVFRRLDYLRNGASIVDIGGSERVSTVDVSYHERLNTDSMPHLWDDEKSGGLFSDSQVELLKDASISVDDIQRIVIDALAEHNLLSEHPVAELSALNRSGRTPDGKFQVLVGAKDTFAVDGVRGLFKIPNHPVSLYTLLTVAGAHEFEHVNQAQADLEFGRSMRIGLVTGKGVSAVREAGANRKQRAFERELSGESKPFALTYAKALQALENGGDLYDMADAFYLEKLRLFPKIDKQKAADEASDRVLRLIAYGKNSQPMVYAEEEILHNELVALPEESRSRATLVTCLNLSDQVKLHEFGLLPGVSAQTIDWAHDILRRTKPLIDDAFNRP